MSCLYKAKQLRKHHEDVWVVYVDENIDLINMDLHDRASLAKASKVKMDETIKLEDGEAVIYSFKEHGQRWFTSIIGICRDDCLLWIPIIPPVKLMVVEVMTREDKKRLPVPTTSVGECLRILKALAIWTDDQKDQFWRLFDSYLDYLEAEKVKSEIEMMTA